MKKYLFLLVVPFFFSCEEEKKKVLDINDILPKASKNYNEESTQKTVDSIQIQLTKFLTAKIPLDSLHFIDKKEFPDRFGAISSEKYRLFNSDSLVLYQKWTYQDSAKTMNAFYNWIDCFGKRCDSYKIGESTRIGTTPKLIVVGDTTLLMIEGQKINLNQWEDFLKEKGFKNWHYWIEQKPYQKAEWFEVKEEKIKLEEK